jgi:Tol biopolymer transport system component
VNNSRGIATISSGGGDRVELTSGREFYDDYPVWSPDGCCIAFFAAREDDNWDVWVMRPDGTGFRRITFGPSTDGELGIDWTE